MRDSLDLRQARLSSACLLALRPMPTAGWTIAARNAAVSVAWHEIRSAGPVRLGRVDAGTGMRLP
jgi:hypothetical protein